jgi:transcriptional regulator with XRE-family HTH domain
MRQILKVLMESKGLTGHSLYDLSGVPSATTYRFLTGRHGSPHADTVRRWAQALGVTEAQLFGHAPIENLEVDKSSEVPMTLESVLTQDELAAIEGMRRLDKETRRSWLRLTKLLCKNTQASPRPKAGEQRVTPDRRRGGMRKSASSVAGVKYRTQAQTDQADMGGDLIESKKA